MEHHLRSARLYPKSVWQLYGAGSVGSQALMGIPRIHALRSDAALEKVSTVWPFETGFTCLPTTTAGPAVLHAEIWPGAAPVDLTKHPIKDAAQILSLIEWFDARDRLGTLGTLFDRPAGLSDAAYDSCLNEEGWILGA